MSTQSANTPLWKVLNEKCPKIKFDSKGGDKNFMRVVGYLVDVPNPKDSKEQNEQEEQLYTASKYTTLAVNEFANVVEALQQLINRLDDSWEAITSGTQNGTKTALLHESKEALSRIS